MANSIWIMESSCFSFIISNCVRRKPNNLKYSCM
uniref:Uncharacterized protein n=1 Tax=Setaria italica TaxID=4555 RepID=K3YFS8_SETIT